MNTKISALFYAKKSKAKNNLCVPVYLRITVSGKRAEFSTGKTIDPSKWSSELSRLKGNSEESRTINKYLSYYQESLKSKEILFYQVKFLTQWISEIF